MADRRSTSNVPPPTGKGRSKARLFSEAARGSGPGLWHRPQVLNLIADLLMVLGATGLGYACVAALSRLPVFPVQAVEVLTPLTHVTTDQLDIVTRTSLKGNFFTVNLDDVRSNFEKLPWVRRADVRRRWPGVIEVRLEEHVATAYWRVGDTGDMRLVNRYGEIFTASSNAQMPVFAGPEGSAGVLLTKFNEFAGKLGDLGGHLVGVSMSAREAWQLKLDDGLTIELGHEQASPTLNDRLERFVSLYPKARTQLNMKVAVVDLRYPNGFALRPVADTAATKQVGNKGK
ncbi:cell division protein FtsQ/DivIB [Zoogloea sp.]|uniref:cell division protein FtsQ/DivIB n=1 Tax=Zoogloea sp. TaxID=49181 RepID=UPI0035B1F2A7